MNRPLRSPALFAIVGGAALLLGGFAILRVLADALADAGVDPVAARSIRNTILLTLAALAVLLFGVALIAGRAYARALATAREWLLARTRGDITTPAPAFAVAELAELVSAAERLAAVVASREQHAAREGAEVSVLLDAISEAILQLDHSGRVLRANPAARALLGLTADSIGRPVAALIRNAQLRRLLEDATRGEMPAAEIALDERRVVVAARGMHGAGSNGGVVVTFLDLTEVRRLEGVRRDFVANVSHELKTPLTSIRGYIETMITDPDMPQDVQRQFLDVVHRNASRLQHIVDDLLDLSRLESGGWVPELHDVDAATVIEDVWSSCRERAEQCRIRFVAPDTTATVRADPGGLRQILSNLFDNALRHTPEGGTIQVELHDATNDRAPRAGNQRGRYIEFEVRDTGSGIPSDALPRIFERFYRVDPARSRADGGTGLGLSIVRHLVESMGGEISATSALGKGTTISFRLPAAE